MSAHLEKASGEQAERCRCLRKDAVSLHENLPTWAAGEHSVGQGVWAGHPQLLSAAMCTPGWQGSGSVNKKRWVQNREHKT